MLRQRNNQPSKNRRAEWITLGRSVSFLLRSKRLIGWSFILVLFTGLFTWLAYSFAIAQINNISADFFPDAPSSSGTWGFIKFQIWQMGRWLFLIIARIISFYLAFLLSYCLTSPGYVFLSTATEKKYAGENFIPDEPFTLWGALIDILEAAKISLFGILVSIFALALNFIPILGQILALLLYSYYSTLMFLDYPASRRRWTLGQKISWIKNNYLSALRVGILPALVSMIPILNIFLMALLFPVFTVYSTLNFHEIEKQKLPR